MTKLQNKTLAKAANNARVQRSERMTNAKLLNGAAIPPMAQSAFAGLRSMHGCAATYKEARATLATLHNDMPSLHAAAIAELDLELTLGAACGAFAKKGVTSCSATLYATALGLVGQVEKQKAAGWREAFRAAATFKSRVTRLAGFDATRKGGRPKGAGKNSKPVSGSDKPRAETPANVVAFTPASGDAKALRAQWAKMKPATYHDAEMMALRSAELMGYLVKGSAKLFDGTETPNRAHALRDALQAFHDALAALPAD